MYLNYKFCRLKGENQAAYEMAIAISRTLAKHDEPAEKEISVDQRSTGIDLRRLVGLSKPVLDDLIDQAEAVAKKFGNRRGCTEVDDRPGTEVHCYRVTPVAVTTRY